MPEPIEDDHNSAGAEGGADRLGIAVQTDRAAALARFAAIREQIGPLPGPTSLEELRADRARDD
jgi:hypothetical protein